MESAEEAVELLAALRACVHDPARSRPQMVIHEGPAAKMGHSAIVSWSSRYLRLVKGRLLCFRSKTTRLVCLRARIRGARPRSCRRMTDARCGAAVAGDFVAQSRDRARAVGAG
jgi:hypothetical protein